MQLQVFIIRSDGITCCMMRSKLDEFDIVLEKGNGVVMVEVNPLQLVGGSYYVEATFLDESDALVITPMIARSDWFTVQGIAFSHNESSVFEPNTRWMQLRNNHSPETGEDG